MVKLFRLFLLCTIISICYPCLANEKGNSQFDITNYGKRAIRVYTDKDGIPQNTVISITFDKKGYLWIGTADGAAYYNGHQWTVVDMPEKIKSNLVKEVLAAEDGSIWFGTNGGLHQWQDGNWKTYTRVNGLPDNLINTLYETRASDGSSIIWAGTNNGAARLQHGQWTIFNTSSGLPDNIVTSFLETIAVDNIKTILIGTGKGLAKLQGEKCVAFPGISQLSSSYINCLQESSSDNGKPLLWIGTAVGLVRWQDGQTTVFDTKTGLPDNNAYCLLETTAPNGGRILWVGTFGGGLAKLQDGEWTTINTKLGLSNNVIYCLMEGQAADGSLSLWIGTEGGGLMRMQIPKWISFDDQTGLPNNNVYGLLESQDNGKNIYWVGTADGLAKFQDGKWSVIDTRAGLPNNFILSLLEGKGQYGAEGIWVATLNGLARWQQGRWTNFDTRTGLPHNKVFTLWQTVSEDGGHIIWAGTQAGLASREFGCGVADKSSGSWIVSNTDAGLPFNRVNTLLDTTSAEGKHLLWIGTYGGGVASMLLNSDSEHGRQRTWTVYNSQSGLPNDFVQCFHESRSAQGERILWIGTTGGVALLNLDALNAQPMVPTVDNVPLNLNVRQIREDAQRRIYLFTSKGVVRLTRRTPTADNPSEYSAFTFTTEEGLLSNQCSLWSSMVDKAGRLWVGTSGGLSIYDPALETNKRSTKSLLIERVKLLGESRAVSQNSPLAYYENNISFEYTLLSYYRESETRYQVQLSRLDSKPSDWIADRKKEYLSLPEGEYEFKVWGKDYLGNISGPISIAFVIRPAPWRTWWAYLFYLCSLVSGGYGHYRYRMRKLEKRNLVLEERVKERTLELADKNRELAELLRQVRESQRETERKNELLDKKNAELAKINQELSESQQRANRIFSALAEALPGTLLDGKYRLDEKIGVGGFGAVYRATHLSMKRDIAVKIFRPIPGNDSAEGLARFQQEAVSASRINHPNAVAVLDSGISDEGIAYLVMELLQGHSLKIELQHKGKLTIKRCAEILLPICSVLEKAHSMGIIHRDIKPDNIFLHQTEDGEVIKLLDFGIAKLITGVMGLEARDLTITGSLIGTPTYIAPERIRGGVYDGKSDVYSLGVMLYEMLCGRPPFLSKGGGAMEVILYHQTQSPPPMQDFNANVSEDVEKVIRKAMEKDPSFRLGVRELAENFAVAAGVMDSLRTYTFFYTNEKSACWQETSDTDEISATLEMQDTQKTVIVQPQEEASSFLVITEDDSKESILDPLEQETIIRKKDS
ncbi:MAG: protein kinase [Acidobacteriota bacterium]